MKKILYLLILIAHFGWANNPQNPFETANQLYQAGKYDQAVKLYEEASENHNLESAELYFNLGNCYYKLHKVALAIFNYEKAKQLNTTDSEIQTNLEFARKMAIDDIKIIPKVGFGKILLDFTSSYHFDTWAWISVIQAVVFLFFFIGYYFSGTSFRKRIFFIGMFIVSLSILVSIFSAYYERNRLQNEKPAIVFSEIISVKSEPKKSSQDAFVLHEGTKVFIIDSVANWKKIQLTDETTGWIQEKAIRSLHD